MQALVERDTTPVTVRREAVIEAITVDSRRPYRAPLATLAVLLASARATAAAQERSPEPGRY